MSDKSADVIAAFTPDQTHRLTGVSLRQLRYWEKSGFFIPSIAVWVEDEFRSQRLYSFRDLVSLKIVSQLRNEVNVPLHHLREVKDRLAHLGEAVWASTTLYVLGKRVVFDNPDTGEKEDAGNGQGVLQVPLRIVSGKMEEAVKAMRRRDEKSFGRVDPARKRNPYIAGTRIPVQSIKDFVEAGYTTERILKEYPSLTPADVEAAINYKDAA